MTPPNLPPLDVPRLYAGFDAPIASLDCGTRCAPHNPNRIPFCCDICQAVPVAYPQEWAYLQEHTTLWHTWRGDECAQEPTDPAELLAGTPEHLLLLACKGPAHCERQHRASSCRQFPFFPYISSRDRFLGLAYHWDFEPVCWVISHLGSVSQRYRQEFVQTYDAIFALWEEEFDSYAALSEEMRAHFAAQRRRFPLLHRNGSDYLVSPASERLARAEPAQFRRFGFYEQDEI